jgi:DNA-binding response OmpR family regulator
MRRITILITDDEEEIADLVALRLQKEGYHFVKASDGKAAIHAIQSQSIDLAILDIMMEKNHLPIIFLSAKTSDLDNSNFAERK